MVRILALALLTIGGSSLASDRSVPFLEQKQLACRSQALSAAVFLDQGKFVATASLTPDAKGAIQLWNLQTWASTDSLPGHTGGVFSLAASPGGKYLASGGDGQVAIYDAASKKENSRIAVSSARVLALAFAPNAATLAAAGEGRQIHLLDVSAGKLLESITAHDEAITSLVFAPDGKRLYSGSYDGTVKIWELPGGKLVDKLTANGGRIHGLALSSDGKSLAAACAGNPDGEVKYPEVALWNLKNNKQHKSLRDGASGFTGVQFSKTGSLLAAANAAGWVATWTADGQPCARLQAHRSRVTSLNFSPDGNSLITTSWEPEARLWDLPRLKAPVAVPGEFTNPTALVYDARAHELIAGGMEKVLHLVDPAGIKPPRQLQLRTDSTQTLAVSPDSKYLASSAGRTEAVPGRPIRARFGMAPPPVVKPELVTLWDLDSAKELRTLAGHQGLIQALAFSPDSLLLASGSADKSIRLWDVAKGIEKLQLIGHASPIVALAFQLGGRTLASGSDDGVVRLWDVRTGHEKRAFQAHPNGLNGLTYSPDGRFLASSSVGHGAAAIALWDAETAENRWLLSSNSGGFLGDVTFSPDGRLLLAAGGFISESGLIRIIDVALGRPRVDWLGGKAPLASICLSPDGKSLFSAGQSTADKGELLRWSLPTLEAP